MKITIAILLALSLCLGLCACGSSEEKQTTPTTEPPIIESGMKIDTLFGVFSAPEEDYQEKVIEGILISGYLLFNWSIHAQAKGKVDIIISGLTSTMYLASLGV